MLILVIVRLKIKNVDPPKHNWDHHKRPFFPGFEYLGNNTWATNEYAVTNARETAFFDYDNYTTGNYHVERDKHGPLFLLPLQCQKHNSFVIPQVPSMVIAVVGPSNAVQDSLTAYLEALFDWQKSAGLAVDYSFKYFESQSDLYAYVTDPLYLNITAGYEGVCFGYEISQ